VNRRSSGGRRNIAAAPDTHQEVVMEILNPTIADPSAKGKLAPRIDTLDGKVVGYIHGYGGDRIPKRIDELLSARFKIASRLWYKKEYIGEPVSRQVQDQFVSQCDVIVTTLGG
jgi:hypothetical protein